MNAGGPKTLAAFATVGFVFGYALSRMGFADFAQVHAMFRLADLRLLWSFMVAVVLLTVLRQVFKKKLAPGPRPITKGTIPGGIFFGLGWAITGACPSVALVKLGEGQGHALLMVAGVLAGSWLCGVVRERWLKWPASACDAG